MGATWLRRGLRNRKCMPRMRNSRKSDSLNINANDENFAGVETFEPMADAA